MFFTFLLLTQDLNKVKKSRRANCRNVEQETCANFLQKILNSMVVGACQSLQLFTQIRLNLGIVFYITWLVLTNYEKICPENPILN